MTRVLITGCNSGFGYYTAECFAAAGHRVFATARPQEDMTQLKALADTEGYEIEILPLEMTDGDQIRQVRDRVLADGPLDVLVNNAGRVVIAPFEEITEEDVRAIFEVNVFGLFNLTREFLPSMRANKSGTIVNLTSPASEVPSYWYSVYAASKAAVNAMSKALAQEVAGWNIRVILIYPGNFKTNILNTAAGELTSPEDSPYYELRQTTKAAMRTFYASVLESDEDRASRETGRPVGEAIFSAVFDGTDEMHYPVGSDARAILASRNN